MSARQRSDSLRLGLLLALAGGFLDAYTYLARGGVFANAQTGNLVLLSAALFNGEFARTLRYLLPIGSFFGGVIVAQMIRARWRHVTLHWRQIVLAIELLIICGAGFVPQSGNAVVNAAISFVCALQMNAFRKVHDNPITTTMCTGNLRSAAEYLYIGVTQKDKRALHACAHYFSVIGTFMLGAGIGAVCVHYFAEAAILACAALLVIGIFVMHETQSRAK